MNAKSGKLDLREFVSCGVLAMAMLSVTPAQVFAKGATGVVVGNQAAQQQQQQKQTVQQQLNNPANFNVRPSNKTPQQVQSAQQRLQSEMKAMLSESQNGSDATIESFVAQFSGTEEAASLDKILVLTRSGAVSGDALEVVKAFLKL